ncbi:hypothetical protein [Candidatus Nitrospira neomarina]|uniref:TIGR02646 family protein n=1 Tax=Candidatus Nitrospira neomarina TaxID=3020899 RepID=A0AA96GK18_9BACT|nr:hypothetical protein [Candidatus Nitrospira neomarina]WNM63366.1 hypothetical protein PQG83_06315 [Candidatus Nitrospira neomarina]
MRYIPLRKQTPDAAWLANASTLLTQLKDAPDAESRNKIIADNGAVWGEMKQWLLKLSHQKCWFSEAKDCFSHWDVEHYRPKKSAKDTDGKVYDGYWWLAFDWLNFRICGNAGNRKKGTFFPLRAGCPRCAPLGDLRHEDAQLLDPIDEDDPALLSFNVEGRAIPAAHVTDEWEKARVEYSVERYNLDFPPLMDKRKTVWAECWNRIQEYLDELTLYHTDRTNGIAKDRYKQAARHLRELMHEEKELSAVAKACILSTGDPRLAGLIQSA